jgi:hypothetical protein
MFRVVRTCTALLCLAVVVPVFADRLTYMVDARPNGMSFDETTMAINELNGDQATLLIATPQIQAGRSYVINLHVAATIDHNSNCPCFIEATFKQSKGQKSLEATALPPSKLWFQSSDQTGCLIELTVKDGDYSKTNYLMAEIKPVIVNKAPVHEGKGLRVYIIHSFAQSWTPPSEPSEAATSCTPSNEQDLVDFNRDIQNWLKRPEQPAP